MTLLFVLLAVHVGAAFLGAVLGVVVGALGLVVEVAVVAVRLGYAPVRWALRTAWRYYRGREPRQVLSSGRRVRGASPLGSTRAHVLAQAAVVRGTWLADRRLLDLSR